MEAHPRWGRDRLRRGGTGSRWVGELISEDGGGEGDSRVYANGVSFLL